MPFGMGPAGWYFWPYAAYWARFWHPRWAFPYFYSPWFYSEEQEEAFLEEQMRILEGQLAQIKKRLEELKKQKVEKK